MKGRQKKLSAPDRLPVLVDDCPCTQIRCHRHGNCVECIRVHRIRQEHIPECLQEMFRSRVGELAALVEYGISDLRRTPAYWDKRLGKEPPSRPRRPGGSAAKKPSGKNSTAKRKQAPGKRSTKGPPGNR